MVLILSQGDDNQWRRPESQQSQYFKPDPILVPMEREDEAWRGLHARFALVGANNYRSSIGF